MQQTVKEELMSLPNSNLPYEFHISRRSRDKYNFKDSLFSSSGAVILANIQAARQFCQQINDKRDLARYPEMAVKAGQINAIGLMDELFHLTIAKYREDHDPEFSGSALEWLEQKIHIENLEGLLRRFIDEFPPVAVYRGDITVDEYINGESQGIPNRQIALEEMLLLWIENQNPALTPFVELIDDSKLGAETHYKSVIDELHLFFKQSPEIDGEVTLIDLLRAPALADPHSLNGQLDYILKRWGKRLGGYIYRILGGMDYLQEEEKPVFFGPGPSKVIEFTSADMEEPEAYSQDLDWMPRLILIAKNSYVWLDQLSKKYQQNISSLDMIPEEEFKLMAERGFTGLWLIGLWERSLASQRIKHLCGNPDAVASAYSLLEYEIAEDLGGWPALEKMREKAWKYGVRLASDMVPNHMGIDSTWVIEHPDWFLSLDYSPFPAYSFNGADLSADERVGIYLEDHYYSRSDAAVVFKRLDKYTGSEKYIYHGNDGTNMPWNDTAQLNFLSPEVREAIIQTILHVARNFPVIRFDAAMTLAKKHIQRLWFPEPGYGGAIVTRAEHSMTRADFDKAIPIEFWREVVDRVAVEAPDTLLLAEAFWMMEGYFVRSLGMHRVYNSAFMNMMRDEENAKYRIAIKNTLEFDPEILKRYVNFLNNPDEKTAVEQFGKSDKYFGICAVMSTLPGLPMFGHGQVEGMTEKYGMEYRRAQWDEKEDAGFAEHHKQVIFPILHQRRIFAGVDNFYLYDFYTQHGNVDENVFAYSNMLGNERGLVLYHNKFASTRGTINKSAGYLNKDDKQIWQKDIWQGMNLSDDPNALVRCRELFSNLEYLWKCSDIKNDGLSVELNSYQCMVFVDFEIIVEESWGPYSQLADTLDGRGVPGLNEAMHEMMMMPAVTPVCRMIEDGANWWLNPAKMAADQPDLIHVSTLNIAEGLLSVMPSASIAKIAFADNMRDKWLIAREIAKTHTTAITESPVEDNLEDIVENNELADLNWRAILSAWLTVHDLAQLYPTVTTSRALIDDLHMGRAIARSFTTLGLDAGAAEYSTMLVKVLTEMQLPIDNLAMTLFKNLDVQKLLGVNRHHNTLYFNRESFIELCDWLSLTAKLNGVDAGEAITNLLKKAENAGYQVEKVIEG
jgi:glycosidase